MVTTFFQITTAKGTKIITDPIAPGMYPTPDVSPHAITVGREHPNHNYVEIAKGNPIVLRGLGNYGAEWNKISTTVRDVLIYTVPVYQQQLGNALKGAAFVFDLGTLCIAHLGDLAHKLTAEQIKAFGKVDIAMIPIGGSFTMPPDTAREVLQQLKPKVAIPMHYRESTALLDMFVKGFPNRYLPNHSHAFSKAGTTEPNADYGFYTLGNERIPIKALPVRMRTGRIMSAGKLQERLNFKCLAAFRARNSSSRFNFCLINPCS